MSKSTYEVKEKITPQATRMDQETMNKTLEELESFIEEGDNKRFKEICAPDFIEVWINLRFKLSHLRFLPLRHPF